MAYEQAVQLTLPLGTDEVTARRIEVEAAFIRVDITDRMLHEEFVKDNISDPVADLAVLIRAVCLHRRAQVKQIGELVQGYVETLIAQAAKKSLAPKR